MVKKKEYYNGIYEILNFPFLSAIYCTFNKAFEFSCKAFKKI